MIIHFADKNTKAIFEGKPIKRVPLDLQKSVLNKLMFMHAASSISELQAIPGLHCKVYKLPLWSIRVNNQYRLTFTFTESPLTISNVMFSDYH